MPQDRAGRSPAAALEGARVSAPSKNLSVGSHVRVNAPTNGYHGRTGVVTDVWGMVSAAGIKRVKWSVQFPHSRTKSKTVNLAFEIDQLEWL